jgi:hypothetical protein
VFSTSARSGVTCNDYELRALDIITPVILRITDICEMFAGRLLRVHVPDMSHGCRDACVTLITSVLANSSIVQLGAEVWNVAV